MTRRQNNKQWSGGTAAHPVPKKFLVQKSVGKVLASIRFFGIKKAPSSLIIFQRPNYQLRVLLIPAGAIEGYFEGETPREVHQGGLVLAL